MGTRDEAYALCMEYDGTEGGEPFWSWMFGYPYSTPGGTPYCSTGVSYVLDRSKTRCEYLPNGCAHDYRNFFNGRDVDRYSLEFMDPISYDWDRDGKGDHEGFFLRYLGDGLCETFEFNTGRNSQGYNGGCNKVCVRSVEDIVCGIRPYWDEEEEVTQQDKEDIARMVAEYVYGDQDRNENLNNYNALHWGFRLLQDIAAKLERIIAKLGA